MARVTTTFLFTALLAAWLRIIISGAVTISWVVVVMVVVPVTGKVKSADIIDATPRRPVQRISDGTGAHAYDILSVALHVLGTLAWQLHGQAPKNVAILTTQTTWQGGHQLRLEEGSHE